ncbi:MAG: hypothetical protein GXC78_03315 [Chitinophagaceae bacterium]|jgi:hypothetical protein|nr:hypothetical protein [Chitinophagaceae bacterium]
MKFIFFFAFVVILCACNRDEYVTSKVKLSRVADGCASVSAAMRSISNIGGERFEFQKCLPDDEKQRRVIAERRGDTVVVRFDTKGATAPLATFDVILDIDSYPAYRFITIDDNTFPMTREDY